MRNWIRIITRRARESSVRQKVYTRTELGGPMKRIVAVFLTVFLSAAWSQGGNPNYKPKRLNKAIELLADGQPIYNTSAQGGDGYDAGLKLANTHNDFIIYEMEHG